MKSSGVQPGLKTLPIYITTFTPLYPMTVHEAPLQKTPRVAVMLQGRLCLLYLQYILILVFIPHQQTDRTVLIMNSSLPCPVQGNADLYGLGIRLGIYTQMLAVQLSSLSSLLTPHPTHYLSQSTIIFLLATISVLLRELRAHALQPVELFPILTLLLAQLRVCRVPLRRGQTTALIYTLELLAIVVLFVWFWFSGMDHMPRACADDKAFFFARVSIWHWFRTLNKVSSVFFAVGGGLAVVAYLMAIGSFAVLRLVNLLRGMGMGTGVMPVEAAGVDVDGQLDARGLGVTAVDLLVNVGAIVYVEVSLKWNHVVGVQSLSSAGQFMPFFVSLAQLFAVVYDGARTGLKAVAEVGNPSDVGADEEHEEKECPHGGGWLTKDRHQTLPLANIQPKQGTQRS